MFNDINQLLRKMHTVECHQQSRFSLAVGIGLCLLLADAHGQQTPLKPLEQLRAQFNIPFESLRSELNGSISARPANGAAKTRYASLLFEEFSRYPKSLIARVKLKRVVLCEGLSYRKQLRAAIPDFGGRALYLDVSRGAYSPKYQRLVIHHEFYHLIDYADDGLVYKDRHWAGLNPSAFQYGSGGAAVQKDSMQGQFIRQPGFLTRYSMSGIEEDKAELFAHLIVSPLVVRKRLASDGTIKRKVQRLKATLQAFESAMNEEWWIARKEPVRKQVERNKVRQSQDWPMRGRTAHRNPVTVRGNPPVDWSVGLDDKPRQNIRWTAQLGSVTSGTPVVANGLVWVGTNSQNGQADASVLMCFRESDGELVYKYVSKRLPDGRNYDWPSASLASSPLIEGGRLWFCTNRCTVVCLNIKPLIAGTGKPQLAWEVDMRKKYGVVPRSPMIGNPCSHCSVAGFGKWIYVNTNNSRQDRKVPAPEAPSLLCLERGTGELVWSDKSPGENIMYSQQGNPTVFESDGTTQVALGQGDGWLRSFECATGKLLWEFNMNPADAVAKEYYGRLRSYIPTAPVFYEGRLYAIAGSDPESGGGGAGRIVCLDPRKRGDVSSDRISKAGKPVANPNSAVLWEHQGKANPPKNYDGIHQAIGGLAIQRGLVITADIEGIIHCYDAVRGTRYWRYESYATSWSSPLIVKNRIYLGTEDGDLRIMSLTKKATVLAVQAFRSSIETSAVFANGTLYVATRSRLHAIREE